MAPREQWQQAMAWQTLALEAEDPVSETEHKVLSALHSQAHSSVPADALILTSTLLASILTLQARAAMAEAGLSSLAIV